MVIQDPVELNEAAAFSVRGEYWPPGLWVGDPPGATIFGTLVGSTLELHVSLGNGAETFPLTLESGVQRDPDEVPVCPL